MPKLILGPGDTLCGALTILLVAMKAMHIVSWPWWVILAPFWTYAIIVVVLVGIIMTTMTPAEMRELSL